MIEIDLLVFVSLPICIASCFVSSWLPSLYFKLHVAAYDGKKISI